MSGNGSGGENGRILTHDFPKTVQTLPCMSHTASMGLGASGMWSSGDRAGGEEYRQGGAEEEHKTHMSSEENTESSINKKKTVAAQFSPTKMMPLPHQNKTETTAKVHSLKKTKNNYSQKIFFF